MADGNTASMQEGAGASESKPAGGSFEPISTQEEFDNRIKSRISRAEASARKAVEAEYAEAIEKAKEYDKMMESSKSELDKATERAEKLQRELDGMRAADQQRQWAAEAAEATGVDASLLRGTTAEEYMEHAESIKAAMDSKQKYAGTPSSGKPGGESPITKKEILEIKDRNERQRLIGENLHLFTT